MLKTAYKFLIYDKAKSIGALFGVIVSVFLVGQQTGIFLFLTGAMSALVTNQPDLIWVVDNKTTNVNQLGTLDTRIGGQLESIKGVRKAYPLVISGGAARFPNGKSAGLQLVGSQGPDFVGGPWKIWKGSTADLFREGAIITDVFDKKTLGDAELGDYFEIAGRKSFIAAQTRGVRGFGAVYAFTTLERARILANMGSTKVSAYLVSVEKGADTSLIMNQINQHVFGVRAWKRDDFAKETILTVLKSSGIAFSFGTLVVFALITGFVIIGLTLYSAAIDRIKDYGTLKAIGAKNSYIRKLILTQALIFAVIGYAIGYGLVEAFRNGIANAGTIFQFNPTIRVAFFLVTLLICVSGTLFAIRRIVKLEPASIFRG